ncbi:hypothetical protein [Agaribacterium sp. ZY112]|uniref:hypothetical protein n=1 Tax=Agaribacterium sp. ZY112 TaxID=3233574 RepID=UPI00352354FA
MPISFKLGLLTQEIALFKAKEVAQLKLLEVMSLPAAYIKGAVAMQRSKKQIHKF